jgi:hypothetical protein
MDKFNPDLRKIDFFFGLSTPLYLGFAFPPGVAAFHPGINLAGHALETQMIAELRRYFDIPSRKQTARLAGFMREVCENRFVPVTAAEALAA